MKISRSEKGAGAGGGSDSPTGGAADFDAEWAGAGSGSTMAMAPKEGGATMQSSNTTMAMPFEAEGNPAHELQVKLGEAWQVALPGG